MAKKRTVRRQKRIMRAPKECFFCKEKKDPDFKEQETLRRFTTDRGKIIARSRNGICAKHQRALARNIKYARHLALLPFVGQHH